MGFGARIVAGSGNSQQGLHARNLGTLRVVGEWFRLGMAASLQVASHRQYRCLSPADLPPAEWRPQGGNVARPQHRPGPERTGVATRDDGLLSRSLFPVAHLVQHALPRVVRLHS